jgi:haloalkane dehalogenase
MHRDSTETLDRPSWLGTDVWPHLVRTYHHPGPDGGVRPLHYLDEGPAAGPEGDTAPTLVLVHAGMWSFVWRDLVGELRSRFRCLAIDFPGAGLTPGTGDEVDLASFASLLGDWLDHLRVERATFVVHDLGGVVGVTAAAARPERVEGIVAVNSFAWPADTAPLRAMLRILGAPTTTAILGSLRVVPRLTRTRFGVGRHLDRDGRRAFYGPYALSRAHGRNFHRALASAARSAGLFADADRALRTTLAGLPVLTVFGERNDPFGFADGWRERFPSARAHTVSGGNHFPMCDAPRPVAARIADWHRAEVATTVTW